MTGIVSYPVFPVKYSWQIDFLAPGGLIEGLDREYSRML